MPKICEDLKINAAMGTWIANVETILIIIAATFASQLGEKFSIPVVFITGGGVFSIANIMFVIRAISSNYWLVIALRCVASFGIGLAAPSALPLALYLLGHDRFPKIIAFIALTTPFIGIISSLVAGIVAEKLGWQFMCVFTGIMQLAVVIMQLIKLPFNMPRIPKPKFDIIGTVILTFALSAIMFGLISLGKDALVKPLTATVIIVVGVFLAAFFFLYNFKWSRSPIFSRKLLVRQLVMSELTILIISVASWGETYIEPYIYKFLLKLTISQVGYCMMAPAASCLLFAPLTICIRKRLSVKTFGLVCGGIYFVLELLNTAQIRFIPTAPGIAASSFLTIGMFVCVDIAVQTVVFTSCPAEVANQAGVMNSIVANLGHGCGNTLAIVFQHAWDGGNYSAQSFSGVILSQSLFVLAAIAAMALLKRPQAKKAEDIDQMTDSQIQLATMGDGDGLVVQVAETSHSEHEKVEAEQK